MFATLMIGLFLLAVPLLAFSILRFADSLLMERIPEATCERIRTDVYSMRAAYVTFLAGVVILCLWAVVIMVLGSIAAIELLLR